MANISQIKKIIRVVNQADITASNIVVPVLWDSPFNDTNYALSWTIEISKAADLAISAIGYFPQTVTNVTRNGFTANINPFDPAVVGDTIVIHAIASHK